MRILKKLKKVAKNVGFEIPAQSNQLSIGRTFDQSCHTATKLRKLIDPITAHLPAFTFKTFSLVGRRAKIEQSKSRCCDDYFLTCLSKIYLFNLFLVSKNIDFETIFETILICVKQSLWFFVPEYEVLLPIYIIHIYKQNKSYQGLKFIPVYVWHCDDIF
jgi:hypothetical protein